MKLSQVLGTLTILTGCISALFFADVLKVIKYNKGDIRNYNTIALHELKKGDLVQGTICLTDGYIAEEEETKKSFGVEAAIGTIETENTAVMSVVPIRISNDKEET